MADRIQHRRDTKANWEQYNPVLLEGEIGLVMDDPNLYKVGDGTNAWNDLPFRGFDGTIVHGIGSSANSVMSQKAVCDVVGLNDYPSFTNSKDYSYGDIVNYQNSLYKFMTSHSAGEWNESEVKKISLNNFLSDNILNLDDLLISTSDREEVAFIQKDNCYWNGSYIPSDSFNTTEKIQVLSGEKYLVKE